MSGLEVVAAVAAVVSAFHGGSELVKIIKEKRRKARQSQQQFEEKQLQESLIAGEQQIGSRYAQDVKDMGDIMVVGDTLARDLLLHIAVNMQAEIIKGLQMAVQNPTVVLNLRLLHEATITNRKDAFVTLNELRQRLILTRSLPRAPQEISHHHSLITTAPSIRSNTFDLSNAVPEDHIPSAVMLGPPKNMKEPKSPLARYLQTKRSNSTSSKMTAGSTSERPNINYCRAFEEMVKARGEDRAALMNDIDEITMLYKGLDGGSRAPLQQWDQNYHPSHIGQRRDTIDGLSANALPQHSHHAQIWDPLPASETQSPPHLWINAEDQDHSKFSQGMFGNLPQHGTHELTNPYPIYQTQSAHRISDASTSSINYSDLSRDRHGSDSSRTSYGSSDPRYSLHSPPMNKSAFATPTPTNTSLKRHDEQRSDGQYNTYAPHSLPTQAQSSPIAPLMLPNRNPSWTTPQCGGHTDSLKPTDELANSSRSQYTDPSRVERSPNAIAPFASPPDSPIPHQDERSNMHSLRSSKPGSDVNDLPSSHSSSSGYTVKLGSSSMPWLKTASAPVVDRIRQPSIASTDSSGSSSFGVLPRPASTILSSTIKSPQPGQERMMNGRPCKDNNYWGFCKGAWDVREDVKKGLALRTMPSGMYNTKEVWECKSCNFRGNTYSVAHPTKKGKKETIVDPNIHTSKSGIRYRWIFLSKSHVKKKTLDSANEECNYGCVICSVELKVTSVFGNVDTLMYHLLEHASDMTQMTMKQTKCIVGRMAGADEDWDINMPLFADVSEVEG